MMSISPQKPLLVHHRALQAMHRSNMKTPLIDKLVHYLFERKEEWVPKGQIDMLTWRDDKGKRYMSDTVARKLREAESLKRIAVKEDKNSVVYRWLPFERRTSYIPTSEREGKTLFRV